MNIKKLTDMMIRKIAAGEIIERPSSILKELIENSIDANSSKIEISLIQGGLIKIKVRDDGEGISKKDLRVSIEKYTTSKVNHIDDLDGIKTLGFRGEALSSISSVSKLLIESSRNNQPGWQIKNEGSYEIEPSYITKGTNIEANKIFYNMPARYKFMKHARIEYMYSLDVFKKAALSNFNIHFKLFDDGKKRQDLAPCYNFSDKVGRIKKIIGLNFIKNTIYYQNNDKNFFFNGWIQKSDSKKSLNCSYLFVNGRIVKDKIISHPIRQALFKKYSIRKKLGYILYIICNPFLIDVNVHPQKKEVRFVDFKNIYLFLYKSIFNFFETHKVSIMAPVRKIRNKKSLPKTNQIGDCEFICEFENKYIIGKRKRCLIFIDTELAHKSFVFALFIQEWKKKGHLSFKLLIKPIVYDYKNKYVLKKVLTFRSQKFLKSIGIYISLYRVNILITKLPNRVNLKKYNLLINDIIGAMYIYELNYNKSISDFIVTNFLKIILKYSSPDIFTHQESQELFSHYANNRILLNKKYWHKIVDVHLLKKLIFNK